MLKSCLSVAFLFSVLAMASSGQAACFYNEATYPYSLDGPDAHLEPWVIHPSNHRCTDGVGGSYTLQMINADYNDNMSYKIMMDVDDHGWITVARKDDIGWKAESKNKNGDVVEMQYMKPLSSEDKE